MEIQPESLSVRKVREQLQSRLNDTPDQTTLHKTKRAVENWIANTASFRVPLENKEMKLFNNNGSSALPSEHIAKFAQDLFKDL